MLDAISSTSTNATASTSTKKSENTQDRFLTMLIAQMNNQDPLNPMDNAAVTSQMAQINTVNGIEKLNQTMGQMLAQTGAVQGAGLVGRGVLVEGNSLALKDGQASAGFELEGKSSITSIEVLNAAGKVVDTLDVGNVDAGVHRFGWDGKDADGNAVPEGNYTFRVNAMLGTEVVPTTALAAGTVQAVSSSNAGLQLDVEGLGSRDYDSIKSIF